MRRGHNQPGRRRKVNSRVHRIIGVGIRVSAAITATEIDEDRRQNRELL
jgi:hypothetical protein